VKTSSFFLLGIAIGVAGTLMYTRLRREAESDDFDLLAKKVDTHLKRLETRLDSVVRSKTRQAV
jgi:hypothetical protein